MAQEIKGAALPALCAIVQVKAPAHDPIIHELIDHKGPLMLVMASPQAYFGESKEAKPDSDEPPLPFGDPENEGGALNFLRHYFYSPAGGSSIGLRYRHRPERIQFTEIRRRKSRP
jgi:hypothetical protein